MIDELLKEIRERPMLHGCIVGTLGMVVAQTIWAQLPGWHALIAVLVWAYVVASYITRNS